MSIDYKAAYNNLLVENTRLEKELSRRANPFYLIEWIKQPWATRKTAIEAFTEGPERNIAYHIEKYGYLVDRPIFPANYEWLKYPENKPSDVTIDLFVIERKVGRHFIYETSFFDNWDVKNVTRFAKINP